MKKRILIYIYVNTEYAFVEHILFFLLKNKIATPLIILNHQIHNLEKEEELCKKHNFEYISINKKEKTKVSVSQNKVVEKKNKNKSSFYDELKDLILFPIRLFKQYNFFHNRINFYKKFLKSNHISAVICLAQGILIDRMLLIKASNILEKKVIIFPFAISADSLEKKHYNLSYFEYKRLGNKIFSLFYKNFIKEYNGKKIIAKPPQEAIALRLLGIYPKNPWSPYSGSADFVISESPFMTDFLINEQVKSKQIFNLGRLTKCVNVTNFPTKFILCAFPPIQPDGKGIKGFINNDELISFWFSSIRENFKDKAIVVSLHPRLNKKYYSKYINTYNLTLAIEPIEHYIPHCDFLIACVSSVIRDAIKYRKPVINYDVYNFQYSTYSKNKGVVTVYEKEDYVYYLNKISSDKDYFQELKKYQEEDSTYFGNINKDNTQEYIDFFKSIV